MTGDVAKTSQPTTPVCCPDDRYVGSEPVGLRLEPAISDRCDVASKAALP